MGEELFFLNEVVVKIFNNENVIEIFKESVIETFKNENIIEIL